MRTTITGIALLTVAAMTTGTASAASDDEAGGRFDRPRSGFAPTSTELHDGSPAEAGLDARPIDDAQREIAAWTNEVPGREHPMYAGAVSLLAHDGTVVDRRASGHELRYADDQGSELPPSEQERTRPDTIFDIASLTKLFTSIAVMQQVEQGAVRLDAPVARYLPEFGANGKQSITVEQLLTHTSGLQPEVSLWKLPPEQRVPAVMDLTPQHPPGSTYQYSDPNLITAGWLVERVAGKKLDEVVSSGITEPLGMHDTGYNPPPEKLHRVAATEYVRTPPRGMVRGQTHDENAWSLGGVAGEAGLFSTADDLAKLGQALLNGGSYGGNRILEPSTVHQMLSNRNARFPDHSHGLGYELDQRWYMAGLSSPRSAGHTGFTGTSIVIDPKSRSLAVLLTNRVHPARQWGSNNPAREKLAQGLAQALAVRPAKGSRSWFTGAGTAPGPATLTTDELGPVAGRARVSFDAFVDTQNDGDGSDPLSVESSVDGGATWQPVSLHATGPDAPVGPRPALAGSGHRAWWKVTGSVPARAGQKPLLRWNYAPDEQYAGRGVHVDGVSVTDHARTLLDGEQHPERLRPDGWEAKSG